MKILIAEDDAISRKLLQRRLEKWGHEVVEARNGAEAWSIFEQEAFDMVISDWMMPQMDGIDLIRRIRAKKNNNYVYTIILTAKSLKEDLIAGMEAGADDFLTKPFDADELKMRLRAGERIIELQKSLKEKNRVLENINARIQHDLKMAAEIQKSLLPTRAPRLQNVQIEWFFQPCDELAGDIFNVFRLDEKHLGMYVLDVSGHGVAAALRSVTLSYLLSPSHMQAGLGLDFPNGTDESAMFSPAQVVNHLNQQFPLELNTGQFFTILYGILNIPEKTFRYVSAGHPEIILLNGDGIAEVIENAALPVGILEDYRYQENTLQLHSGNRMVLYSDGLVEAKNAGMEEFGKERLQRIMEEWRHRPLKEAIQALTDELRRWKNGEHFEDDVTILALEIE